MFNIIILFWNNLIIKSRYLSKTIIERNIKKVFINKYAWTDFSYIYEDNKYLN